MSLLKWDNKYSVGVSIFDEQHKKMFAIINRFYDGMKVGQSKRNNEDILKELVGYAEYHLKNEEDYFEKYDYPDKDGHKKIHDSYRNKINDFLSEENDDLISFSIIDFLEDWWLGHISQKDKEYTEFFNKKGLE